MQSTFLTLCVAVHKKVAFSDGKIFTFGRESHELNAILMSHDKQNIAFVFLHY